MALPYLFLTGALDTPSNTEPLLRLNVEGFKKEIMEEKFEELKKQIESLAKK